MTFDAQKIGLNYSQLGHDMHEFASIMYPICRSITGQGVRDTLKLVEEKISLIIHEVETGTKVFDWEVPREWNIREAYIKNSRGDIVVDFKNNNLHVVSYSIPVKTSLSLQELKPYLHTIEGQPEAIPYRTSYYNDSWGFCLPYNQYKDLPDDTYEVVIDSSLEHGVLNYGE